MISFPNCKINLGLRIINKRGDGFHELETVFYPLPLNDVLEILASHSNKIEPEFHSSGLEIPGPIQDNLCVKAYHLLKKDFQQLPQIRIHLHKKIPMGAGLGGGSSDAAFTLKMLNNMFNLGLNNEALGKYALELGSDCPFFHHNQPNYAIGRGEIFEPLNINLSPWKILLVHPGIHINTGWAFSKVQPAQPAKALKEIISKPIKTWKVELINDFENICLETYPVLQDLKSLLYNKGAVYVSMSGSGSSFYALFPKSNEVDISDISFKVNLL